MHMQSYITITSQGQITIPAAMRQALKINPPQKTLVNLVGNQVIIEPIPDLKQLKGKLKHKAKTNQPIQETINQEQQAWTKAVTQS